MRIKIKYEMVTNTSPIVEGYCLYFDGAVIEQWKPLKMAVAIVCLFKGY